MAVWDFLRRWIVSVPRQTWSIITTIVIILFLIALISFVLFYSRIYISSLHEEFFTNKINCTISDIQNSNHLCDERQEKTCQLIFGQCSISDSRQNVVLYSTWYDYETSSHQCTINPCLTSEKDEFYINQSLSSIYWSSHSGHGYLKRMSTLEINLAKMIMYILFSILILTCIWCIMLIFILGIYHEYRRVIYPVSACNSSDSVDTQPTSVVIEEPTKDQNNQRQINSIVSPQILATPEEITVFGPTEPRCNERLPRKTLEPLKLTAPPWTITTLKQNNADATVMQNTTV